MSNKWNINTSSTLQATVTSDSHWQATQDETPFLEQAKNDREAQNKRDVGYKKACTIPDGVALQILTDHGINIHADSFLHDREMVKKVLYIMRTEYSHLMSY